MVMNHGMGDVDLQPTQDQLTGADNDIFVSLDPSTGFSTPSGQPPIISGSVDWSNPASTVMAGDIMPNGDTYAGAPITVTQAQQLYGLAATTPAAPATTSNLLVYGALGLVAMLMLSGRR